MEILKKIFGNVKLGKIKFGNFDSNDENFGEQLLKYFQKVISQNIDVDVKTGWVKKDDNFPIITITKGMDEVQKLNETKIVSISFNVWCDNKKNRDFVTNQAFNLIKNIDFSGKFSLNMNEKPNVIEVEIGETSDSDYENRIELSVPQTLDFEKKKGIYRCEFGLTFWVKIDVDKKELRKLKEHERKCEFFGELVMGKLGGFGGELLESNNGKYALFKPSASGGVLALIKNNKILWKKQFQNLVSFDFARDGSFAVVATQLTKKEMGKSYKSGGHVYVITKDGKLKDIKISCDGLSCSISPDSKYFGVTTMGPEWDVYYFDNRGKLLWKKRFDKRVGGIGLTKNQIILYDKIHKETRKKVLELNKKGNVVKRL